MAYYYYGYDFPPTLVDHAHQRAHQHRNFIQYLSHQKPRPEDYPNQPDVDIRDASSEYIIDIEVPGINNPHDINVSWTTGHGLVVSGSTPNLEPGPTRPEKQEHMTGIKDTHGDSKETEPHEPGLLVGERRLGPFRRHFNFPQDVNMEKLTAKLEAGLLRIRVPKKGLIAARTERVNIE